MLGRAARQADLAERLHFAGTHGADDADQVGIQTARPITVAMTIGKNEIRNAIVTFGAQP